MAYDSNITLADAAALLRRRRRVLVTTHAKPDGDAFGSVIALATALRRLGCDVRAIFIPPVPAALADLAGAATAETLTPQTAIEPDRLIVVLDTGAWGQLAPMRPLLEPHVGDMLILDHHLAGDVPAAWRHIDGAAAAACEIIAALLQVLEGLSAPDRPEARLLDDRIVAEALFVGIAADTGWFRFSNTRPETHEWAARLLRLGVDQDAIYEKLEQSERPAKLALLARALAGMELLAGEQAALLVLRARDFAQTGARLEETERFVDLPRMVAGVRVVALVTESPPEHGDSHAAPGGAAVPASGGKPPVIRLSFRSKPGAGSIDVNHLARAFGGGGHARAAGAKLDGPLEAVLPRVRAALEAAV